MMVKEGERYDWVAVSLPFFTVSKLLLVDKRTNEVLDYETGEVPSYIRYSINLSHSSCYAAKLVSSLPLFTVPLVAAKVFIVLSWDYRVLFNPFFTSSLFSFFSNLSLNALYMMPILALLSILVKRPAYYLILVFLKLYILEGRWRLFGVRHIYPDAALWHSIAYITTIHGSASSPPQALFLKFPERFLVLLACAVLTLAWYSPRGEVRWR